jgi:MFS family permease
MSELALERRLIEAFADARASVEENPDLFARVTRSLEDARARRRYRWMLASGVAAFVIANTGLALAFSISDNGRFNMPWWVIEMITNIVLGALASGVGPFIKRFGRSYAADVFRANPRTGKSYLVLTDVAYYLIFTSFVLFTVSFVEHDDWRFSRGEQFKAEVGRVGGILLIMGILHAANVVALPIIGRLLSSNKRLDDARPDGGSSPSNLSVPPIGPGTWILRVEQAPPSHTADPPTVE